jgi:preprotein translocase subunit YajC
MIEQAVVILAQAQGAPQGAPPWQGLVSFAPIVIILVLFFFFMHRSEKKRQRERDQMLESIQPRDKVVTIGGIYGRVVSIKGETMILCVDPDKDVRITVSKSAISRKLTDKGEQGEGAY